MIKQVKLHNFKCFKDETFNLGNLTVMTGVNGVGKSTLIQSLLLLNQSYACGNIVLRNTLRFSSDLVDLQHPRNVRYIGCEDEYITIVVVDDQERELRCSVEIGNGNGENVPLLEPFNFEGWDKSSLFDENFAYLYADRMTPRESYEYNGATPTYSRLGDRTGNNAVFCLQNSMNTNAEVESQLLRKNGSYVAPNVSAWISYIMGANMGVSSSLQTENRAELKYVTKEAGVQMEVSPLNMAFGPTYIFPIVLGLLTAPKGSLFVVENPEAHLHPGAQTRMGEFFSLAAQSGIQVVVESHSDHLMNGVRLAVKHKELDNDKVVYYAVEQNADGVREKHEIHIDDNGELSTWPNGFFDEWENNLVELLK